VSTQRAHAYAMPRCCCRPTPVLSGQAGLRYLSAIFLSATGRHHVTALGGG